MPSKIAIISSHPIQYNAPLFALLDKEPEIDLMVFYTWGEAALGPKYDPDFGKEIEWDIPLLEGYSYTFLQNTSKDPGSHHFKGIINPTLNKEIEFWGADVIWVWGWAFDSHLKAMRHFKGKVPVWFRGDSTLLDEPKGLSFKKIARRLFLTWVYNHIDKAFYVGTHNKAYFEAHGLMENQLVYAPHAIDNDRFADFTGEFRELARKWRRELGYNEDDFILMYIGKFEPNKNLKDLILKFNNSKIYLLLVGNGPLESDLREVSSTNIKFIPFQNQSILPVVYRLANCVVLNSKSETWGLIMNESLASGIPVFASEKCGGAIDLLPEEFIMNDLIAINEEIFIQRKLESLFFAGFLDEFSYSRIIHSVICTLCKV
jgi:glycosyltransferase involved in cell wall biosynthesis